MVAQGVRSWADEAEASWFKPHHRQDTRSCSRTRGSHSRADTRVPWVGYVGAGHHQLGAAPRNTPGVAGWHAPTITANKVPTQAGSNDKTPHKTEVEYFINSLK